VAALWTLLVSTLDTETHIPFEALKRHVEVPPFDPCERAHSDCFSTRQEAALLACG
jgi:hypothetical protein